MMSFFKSKKPDYAANIAQRELEMYKREREVRIDRELFAREKESMTDLHVLRKTWVDETIKLHQEYAVNKTVKMTELAKLNAEIELKREFVQSLKDVEKTKSDCEKFRAESAAKDGVIAELKKQLDRGDDNFKVVVGKLSKMEINSLGLTVTAKTEK